MAKIITTEIEYRYSGGAANVNPNASLGGGISNTAIPDAVLHNLFDEVTGDEAQAGSIKYRCMYVLNGNASLTWQAVKAWIAQMTIAPGSSIAIGLGTSGQGGTEQTIPDEDTAPVGVTFTAPTNKPTGLNLGDIPATSWYPIWVRRTINPGTAGFSSDNSRLRSEGDTVVTA